MCGNADHGVEIPSKDAYGGGVPKPSTYSWAACRKACASFTDTKGCTGIKTGNICRVYVKGDKNNTANEAIVASGKIPTEGYLNPDNNKREYSRYFAGGIKFC